jgi:hypothetical protein
MKSRRTLFALVAVASLSCGGDSTPAPPTAPTPPPFVGPTAVTLGTAGNLPATLAPGASLQLWATARASDGTTTDVTNIAVWQSSDPAMASVSSTGLLRANLEGTVTVSAVYQQVTGTLTAEIRRPGCEGRPTPERLIYNAFGGFGSVAVTTTASDCRWIATATASWLHLTRLPNVSGNGEIRYGVDPNNTPEPRSARILIEVSGGPTSAVEIAQEKPVSCSYVVSPESRDFASQGGAGSFDVITTPGDCQWQLLAFDDSQFRITSGRSGTGRATVTYTIAPSTVSFARQWTIEVRGLSGANPPGIHSIRVAPR